MIMIETSLSCMDAKNKEGNYPDAPTQRVNEEIVSTFCLIYFNLPKYIF